MITVQDDKINAQPISESHPREYRAPRKPFRRVSDTVCSQLQQQYRRTNLTKVDKTNKWRLGPYRTSMNEMFTSISWKPGPLGPVCVFHFENISGLHLSLRSGIMKQTNGNATQYEIRHVSPGETLCQ